MEGILKLLRKLGYSEEEIKTVLNKVPVDQKGIMGTNVATGVFSKPKEGVLAKDFLVSDKIGNPFEIDYYRGSSKEDILKSAEAQLKMIDDEFTKLTDQIINKNLQLTPEQRINFAKNLETRRRFQKDFEAFKTIPEAEVLNMQTGKKVEDVETLKEKSGLMAPPSTPLGKAQFDINRLKSQFEDFVNKELNPEYIAKKEAERKAIIARQYEGKGYAGDPLYGPSGIYRATARDFLLDQNAKGKIKLTDDVVKNLQERNYISGGQPLMYPDPIRVMRYHYGDDIFDKIPVNELSRTSGTKSDILNIMSKVETSPIKIEAPKTPGGYLTPGEYKANIEELQNIEKMIKRRESRFADMTEEEIQNELQQYGSKRSAFEMGLEFDYPEEYAKYKKLKISESKPEVLNIQKEAIKRKSIDELIDEYNANQDRTRLLDEEGGSKISYEEFQDIQKKNEEIAKELEKKGISSTIEEEVKPEGIVIPFRKKFTKPEPEGKANGGPMGLDYLTGMEPPKDGYATGGRVNFQKGGFPKILEYLIEKLSTEKNFNKTLLEKSSPKAIQDLYIEKYGKLPSAEEIKDIVNKQLQNKGSMEVMNPKTGEVTTPKNPIMTVEDLQFKHKDAFNAHDQINIDINDKIAPDMIAESMAEMKGKDYFSLSQKEQSNLYKKALAYVDDVRMTKKQIKSETNKPIEGGFSFNDPDIKAQMEEAMKEAKKRGNEMRAMGLDPAKSKDYDQYIEIKTKSGDKDFNKYFDDLEIKTKFKGRISDDLLNQILIDDNPQRKAEVIATIEQGLTMQEKGMSPEEIVNILKNTTRTKQASGGRIGYAEGSDDAPSITLDNHEKAPGNNDKYPIKTGNLELGISGLITGGKSYQSDPYNKITGSERNLSVRGKYNVPDTGVSLTGDIGDIRTRNTQNINVPEFNYKEKIRDVFRVNPYSVGIEYAPDQNRNINLRYDDRGNVSLRGEYKFAKGGLGYLMGE